VLAYVSPVVADEARIDRIGGPSYGFQRFELMSEV